MAKLQSFEDSAMSNVSLKMNPLNKIMRKYSVALVIENQHLI
jgi:hypothetical protein